MVKILKNQGSFDILTPVDFLSQQIMFIEKAGRTCYQTENKPVTMKTAQKFIKMLIGRGHFSVLEHSILEVRFSNCSRGFTHEQVRHRLTAISQESTRYVDYAKLGGEIDLEKFSLQCIVPPHRDETELIDIGDGQSLSMVDMFNYIERFYRGLRKAGWKPEDARQILPIGIKSQIVISANLREWRHIFFMRTSEHAHWEIRRVMCNLLEKIQTIVPAIFDDFEEAGTDENGLRFFRTSLSPHA